ncbi:Phosphatidate cytidylyltransferase [Galdieria sulphuraria]|nr:Phosphatidate cytidylyltransferase [Galdieria sulphuraria]
MARAKGHLPAHRAGIFVGILQNIVAYTFPTFADTVFPIGGTLICCYLLFRKRQATIADISTSFMGLFYAGYLPSYWIRLHALRNMLGLGSLNRVFRFLHSFSFLGWKPLFSLGSCLTFWTWLSIVGADVGAYFIGKLFGRTKFIEISPKKTVEGALGGFLGSTCISLLAAYLLCFPFWYITGAVYGIMIGVVGLLGDLTASLFKRDAGFKDSGNIIPGHGGILDRTDSYVFTAPLVYYFVTVLIPIIVRFF